MDTNTETNNIMDEFDWLCSQYDPSTFDLVPNPRTSSSTLSSSLTQPSYAPSLLPTTTSSAPPLASVPQLPTLLPYDGPTTSSAPSLASDPPPPPLCYPTPALRLAPPPLWPLFPNPAMPPLYRNRHAARKILALLLQKQMQSCSKPKN